MALFEILQFVIILYNAIKNVYDKCCLFTNTFVLHLLTAIVDSQCIVLFLKTKTVFLLFFERANTF